MNTNELVSRSFICLTCKMGIKISKLWTISCIVLGSIPSIYLVYLHALCSAMSLGYLPEKYHAWENRYSINGWFYSSIWSVLFIFSFKTLMIYSSFKSLWKAWMSDTVILQVSNSSIFVTSIFGRNIMIVGVTVIFAKSSKVGRVRKPLLVRVKTEHVILIRNMTVMTLPVYYY